MHIASQPSACVKTSLFSFAEKFLLELLEFLISRSLLSSIGIHKINVDTKMFSFHHAPTIIDTQLRQHEVHHMITR